MATTLRSPASSRSGLRMLLVLICAAALALPLLPAVAVAQSPGDGGVTSARIRGEQRFQTAARIATATFDQADAAVLVTGTDFPDALAGSYAAGRLAGPILLTQREDVPNSTLDALQELGVQTVVLIGGDAVIGAAVEGILAERGYVVERIAGRDRYRTAAAIARRFGDEPGQPLAGDRVAILASGEDFPDALAAGPLAARARLPLLLTPHDQALPVVDEVLADLGIQRLIIVGGTAAVTTGVAQYYQDRGLTVERFGGATRDATAAVVADNAVSRFEGFSPAAVVLARGDDFPDALTASMHSAMVGAPILLTATPQALGVATDEWLAGNCPEIEVIRALGGTGAISANTLGAAVDAGERCLDQGQPQEVARFSTELLGNPPRTHNIHLAADYIDGDVIPAGDTYSLNAGIGVRTSARGFRLVPDGCIGSGGEAVDCVGGGISQLATTFMNAAWFTGIDFVDFRQHTIYFPRYPMCHEATLSWGSLDVVLHNNSPYPITIDSFYDQGFIGVRFLSQPWAEVSSWSEPQTPPSSGSFTSRCGRTMTYPDGTTSTESYTWTYDGVGF